ncbi:glutathione S-transferase [Globomyces pollinis-pini]|nr:glutathione S-transferase [Globomyces pollinis-pini]KAJ2998435.1 Glutathione S-transferase Mu 4 [Globomyces sp. JEL0801]
MAGTKRANSGSDVIDKKKKPNITLGYWNIRGFAQPIRHLLAWANVEFNNVTYQQGDESTNFDRSDWNERKPLFEKDYPFINLPYYEDEDVKLSQSTAIFNYIARKYGMDKGRSNKELAIIEMLIFEIIDIRSRFVGLCYNQNYNEELKKNYWDTFAINKWKRISLFLGNQKFICGELSSADFYLYEMIYHHIKMFPKLFLETFPNFKNLKESFETIPNIAKYIKTSNSANLPLNNRSAKFGGK